MIVAWSGHDTAMRIPSAPGWQHIRLGEVGEVNPRRPSLLQRDDEEPTTFVPMAAVDEQCGRIARAEVRPFEAVKSGYTYFEAGDVLFAKITPCMQNGKHAIADGLLGGIGFGSTEFHVIRPTAAILPEWLHYFLRQRTVLNAATAHFTGAVGQQRVPESFLFSLVIPLPPVPEQCRIAALLADQLATVEHARAAAEMQAVTVDALTGAYLREVFSMANLSRWSDKRLGDVLVSPLRMGISGPVSINSTRRCLTLTAVRNGELNLVASKPVQVDDAAARGSWVKPGLFYVVRGNGNRALVGRGGHAPSQINTPVLFPDLLIEVNADPSAVHPRFLRWFWDSAPARTDIESRARTAAGIYKINLANLAQVKIPTPPLNEQARIAEMLDTRAAPVQSARAAAAQQLAAVDLLPSALLRQAFFGAM